MDLLDLYHAHEHSLSCPDEYEVHFKNNDEYDTVIPSQEKREKQRKAKFVPWEPFKAAPSSDRKGTDCPEKLPQLIAYSLESARKREPNNNENVTERILRDDRRQRERCAVSDTEKETKLENEVSRLQEQLLIEEKLNQELKRLMIATLNDELQGQVEALTEDKIRLAHRVDQYMGKLEVEDEESDRLRIDRDVWKCKFLAQSIRCDELTSKNEYLLKTLVLAQNALRQGSITKEEARDFIDLDLQPLFDRSPCEERVRPRQPNFVNLTISCCRNCSGREIQLL